MPRDGVDVTVRSAGDTDTTARLLDGAMAEVAMDDGGDGNFQIEATLDAGAYYVEVGGHEAGPYRVLAWGSDPDCDCAEPAMTAMDHGGTAETSTLMSIGPPLTGEVADADDLDVFRIDLAGSATVVFETAGPTDTMGTLRDGAGTVLATAATGGPAMNFSISQELAPGPYYLEVSGAAASYAVSAQLGGDSDHGDTAGLSTLLTFYSQDDVDNIKPQALLSTAAEIDAAETDMDVFRLDIPKDMTEVTIRSVGPLDVLRTAARRLADGVGDGRQRRRLPHRGDARRRRLLRRGRRPRDRTLPRAGVGRLPGTLRLRHGGRRLVAPSGTGDARRRPCPGGRARRPPPGGSAPDA